MDIRQWLAVLAINGVCWVADTLLDTLVVVLESPTDKEIERFMEEAER